MKKRIVVILGLLALAGLLSSGPVMAQKRLVVGVDTPAITMNPHGSADANLSRMANIFDGLLQRVGEEGEIVPALAESYDHPDILTWIFHLRKGVKFHNGNPFTAADVKYSFERLADPEVSEFLNTGRSIASIETPDDYTVIIKTEEHIPWFADNMHQIFIMDKESTENRDPGEIGLKPIGTGAYKLVEWAKGSYMILEANADYWEGAPAIERVEVRPLNEASTRFAALISGQADLVKGIPVELFDKVLNNTKVDVIQRPSRRSIFLALHNRPGTPAADIRVRKAMAMTINEREIISKVMQGHARPAAQIPDPRTIGYNSAIERYSFNPEEANRLMSEAGYINGFDIKLTGPDDRYVQDARIAEAVAKYLAKINIIAKVDVKPKSIFLQELDEGILDFYLIGWFDTTFDMGRTYFKLAHSRNPEKGYGGLNGVSYSDPDIDKLLEETAKIIDPAEREKALQHLNKVAMEEKVVWIPLHYQEDLYAIRKESKVKFSPRPDQWMVFKEMTRAE